MVQFFLQFFFLSNTVAHDIMLKMTNNGEGKRNCKNKNKNKIKQKPLYPLQKLLSEVLHQITPLILILIPSSKEIRMGYL